MPPKNCQEKYQTFVNRNQPLAIDFWLLDGIKQSVAGSAKNAPVRQERAYNICGFGLLGGKLKS